uniref:protein-lysine N-methyltransferase EEF2KMT isoform X2 n=1 Tax=Gasterosteus aculeatus aculeatus TaxID=481459 RepID=UPI001A981A59|nr:protein-lysine N-methyltransferase EEF2KMT isoform X2 [Gasterosteus aculeatus aculeatus]
MEGSEPDRPAESDAVEKTDVLRDFQASFFAMRRLRSFPWTFLEKYLECNKSSDLISDILKQTCLHSLSRTCPPSVRYRKRFLSELIRREEAAGCDPLDELYDALAEVIAAEDTTECYKSYLLYSFRALQPGGGAVSLLESVALISEGTTGLVTWEAALYLAEWALDHRHTFTGRTVLELGSGVGLTGVAICRSCGPSRYVFSDCHPEVLQKLRGNVRRNGLTEPAAAVEELDWTTVTGARVAQVGADVVIAADVVYDPEVVESLVKLLSEVLRGSSPELLVCSTVRNQETYGGFKQQLRGAGIEHRVMSGDVSRVFHYDRVAPVEIISLFS